MKSNSSKISSPSVDKVSNQLQKAALENIKLSAIQNGNSSLLPKHLKILNFCADYNKIFAVCHTKKIPGNPKAISLHVFDVTSGMLEKVISLWDHDDDVINFVDMCMAKFEHKQCVALAYTEDLSSLSEYWFIHFINFGGGLAHYTIALDCWSKGPICAFDSKLLFYHHECEHIIVFNTSKWPIVSNE